MRNREDNSSRTVAQSHTLQYVTDDTTLVKYRYSHSPGSRYSRESTQNWACLTTLQLQSRGTALLTWNLIDSQTLPGTAMYQVCTRKLQLFTRVAPTARQSVGFINSSSEYRKNTDSSWCSFSGNNWFNFLTHELHCM